jgi:hypothetical protein
MKEAGAAESNDANGSLLSKKSDRLRKIDAGDVPQKRLNVA